MEDNIRQLRPCAAELLDDRYLLDTLMAQTSDQVYFKDHKSRFVRISCGLAARLGLDDPAEAIGKTDFDFFSGEHAHEAFADEQRLLQSGESLVGIEERETWADGREAWVSTTKMPLRDSNGQIIGLVGISRDITERKMAAERLAEQAEQLAGQARALQVMTLVDELTGLHNRRGLQTIGEQALHQATREGKPAALLFLDLDGFKQINDTFGHSVGDDALRAIAKVLRGVTRDSDICARVGGDEFCVLVFDDAADAVTRIAARIEAGVRAVQTLYSFPFTLSASIGGCEVDAKTPGSLEEMLSLADDRMYEHKAGKQSRETSALQTAG